MTKGKRTRYSAEFKAKVAKEALKGEETLAQLSVRYGVHANLIAQWKKQAMDGLVGIFSGKPERQPEFGEAQIKELHAKIGQLTVERDFLAKAFGR
jgi:transposase